MNSHEFDNYDFDNKGLKNMIFLFPLMVYTFHMVASFKTYIYIYKASE